jgi:hypothetical protein
VVDTEESKMRENKQESGKQKKKECKGKRRAEKQERQKKNWRTERNTMVSLYYIQVFRDVELCR